LRVSTATTLSESPTKSLAVFGALFRSASISRRVRPAAKLSIAEDAEKFEAQSKDWDHRSDEVLHLHHRLAQATTVIQISIALSAIALLTRKSWLLRGVYIVAAAGLVLGAMAAAHV
jgi:hypothetical protein